MHTSRARAWSIEIRTRSEEPEEISPHTPAVCTSDGPNPIAHFAESCVAPSRTATAPDACLLPDSKPAALFVESTPLPPGCPEFWGGPLFRRSRRWRRTWRMYRSRFLSASKVCCARTASLFPLPCFSMSLKSRMACSSESPTPLPPPPPRRPPEPFPLLPLPLPPLFRLPRLPLSPPTPPPPPLPLPPLPCPLLCCPPPLLRPLSLWSEKSHALLRTVNKVS